MRALADFGLQPRGMRLLLYAFNATFRVDTVDGRRVALRLNVSGRTEPGHLAAETAWLESLAVDSDVLVPRPLPTGDGRRWATVPCPALGRDLPVVAMSWMDGPNLEAGSVAGCRELGRTTALLHRHAVDWALPSGAHLPSMRQVLVDEPDRISADHPGVDDRARAVLVEALAVAQRATDEVWANGPVHVVHADLHGGNVKWHGGRIGVFDFDDSCLGTPAQDLAVALYYLRDAPRRERALFDGYAEAGRLPDLPDDRFEALVAGRNLGLLNTVLGGRIHLDPGFEAVYVQRSVARLRAFLDTGTYRHEVPGLGPPP